jgi:type IV pilus assembly protein PilN
VQITLNLATRPYFDLRPLLKQLRIAMTALAIIAITLAATLYFSRKHTISAYARSHSLDKTVAQLNAEMQGYESMMSEPVNAKVVDQTEGLNQLFDDKSFSWTAVMQDLETVLPAEVQITTIEPVRTKDGIVNLRLHVAGPRDQTIQLIENLERSKRFGLPRILGESVGGDNALNQKPQPLKASSMEDFDLVTDYNPEL